MNAIGRRALALCALALSCHPRTQKPKLNVTLHLPAERAALDEPVTIGFDRALAPDTAPLSILVLEPAVTVSARLADERTLLVSPSPSWPAGMEITVAVKRGTRARDGAELAEPFQFRFRTPDPEVSAVRLGGQHVSQHDPDLRWVRDPSFQVSFTPALEPGEAERRCRIELGERALPVRAKPAQGAIELSPAEALPRDHDAKLVCAHARHGENGASADFALAFHTLGDFQLIAQEPASGSVPADEPRLKLRFSSPVGSDAVLAALTIDPRPKNLRAHGGWDGAVTLEGELTPGQSYDIRLAGTLADQFGQKLGREVTLRLYASDMHPALAMQRGFFVVEASSPIYPFWTRNLPSADLVSVRVPEDRLVPTLAQISLYDCQADLGKLGLAARPHRVKSAGRRNHWQEGALELPTRGVYYAEAQATGVAPRCAFANVTNLGVVAKLASGHGLVWVTALDTGKPVAGAEVQIRDRENKVRFRGKSDATGLCKTPGRDQLLGRAHRAATPEEEEEESWSDRFGDRDATGRLYVVAKTADDLALLADSWQPGTAAWSFGITPDHTPGKNRIRGFLETDRGLYRPGDTVHAKGLVRLLREGSGLRVLEGEKVHVRVSDPRGDTLLEKDLVTGRFGGFALDLPTGREARLGDYRVEARVRDQQFTQPFSVEEYRPASFQVQLQAQKPAFMLGETLVATVQASYFYGAPLQKAKFHYSVRRRDRFPQFPGELAGFVFYDQVGADDDGSYRYRDSSRSELVQEDDAQTGEDGQWKLRVPLSAKDAHGPQDFLIAAEVGDETGQHRSAEIVVPAHHAALYLGLKNEWLAERGKPFSVALVALDTAGKRTGAADVTIEARLRTWDCDFRSGGYHCDTKTEPLGKRTLALAGAGSLGEAAFTAEKPGEVILTVSGKDERGRVARASSTIYVWGGGNVAWREGDSTHLTLVADRAEYRPGEHARVLVQAPFPGTALVTTERAGMLSERLVELRTTAEALDIPLGDGDLPNVYLSVVMVKGRIGKGDTARPRFKIGMATLKVVPEKKKLQIAVAPARADYRPGEKVKVAIDVTDAAGTPVRAEVALAAADEGVLSLVAYKTPDPMAVFYAPWGLGVETATSYERFAHRVEPGEDEDGGVGDGGGDESTGHVRSKFLPTAYWHPALHTNARGHVEVEFDAPDQLTAFRLMAVAADAGDRFGSADKQFRVSKPFALHPMLPRFLSVGDRARLGFVVENDTPHAGTVTVKAAADGLALSGELVRTIQVAKGARVPVTFEARADAPGQATFRFQGALDKERDAVVVTIPISHPMPKETLVVAEGSTRGGATATVAAPKTAIPGEGELDVALDGSGLAGVAEGLRYLVEYPYG
jgi:uncharacterized protein YfaS (alpha-2-macroglobulin family)